MIVRRAIQFHRDTLLRTIEIQDIAPYALLAPEFATAQLAVLKLLPKAGFCRRHVLRKCCRSALTEGSLFNFMCVGVQ